MLRAALFLAVTMLMLPVLAADEIPRVAYEKYKLPNGLEVILAENHRLPLVAVNVWYHVGPANEAPGLTGFAHLFEHMMFAGSKHIPRGLADRLLEAAGATDSNGTTSFDRTNYFDTVPAHQLELALWIHSDRMGYLLDVLDQAALSNQQDVVRNERRQRIENQPYGIVQEALFQHLFPKPHPYHASIMGSHADIQSATLSDVKDFFKRYYAPNNATLAIVGDIDRAKTKKAVERYFGGFQRGPRLAAEPVRSAPIEAERRVVVADRIELPKVLIGWHTPKIYTAEDFALSLAGQVLGGGKSSRLYRSLVYEKQIAQDVAAYQFSLQLGSVFIVEATARPGHGVEDMQAAIDAEIERLRAAPPSAEEMLRARNTIETTLISGLEKVGALADTLNHYNHYTGDPGYFARELAQYRSTSREQVHAAAREFLPKAKRVVVHGVPGEPKLAPDVPVPPAPPAPPPVEAVNKDQPWRAEAPRAGKPKAPRLPSGQTFRLANGLTVIHHRSGTLPLASAVLVLDKGSAANPVDHPGLADFTATMLDEGTGRRSSHQIADEVALLGATLSASASPDAISVELSSLKKNFEPGLGLLADVVLNPAFPNEEVERQRLSRLGQLALSRDDPAAVAATASVAALFGRRHPYGYTQLGTEGSIKATQRDHLAAFWQKHGAPGNAALVLTGALSRAEAETLAQKYFGKWPPGSPEAVTPGQPAPTAARLVIVDKPGAPQTALRITGPGPSRDTADYPALEVLNAALGGLFTSRINLSLREDKGFTYGANSRFLYRRHAGQFQVATSVRTDVTAPAVGEILAEIEGLKKKPVEGDELKRARDAELLSLPGQFETRLNVAASLATTFVYRLGADYFARLPELLRKVDAGAVKAAEEKHLSRSELIVIAVGDRAKIEQELAALRLAPVEYRDVDGNVVGR